MKKIAILFGIITSQVFFSQITRFVYQTTTTPDSTNIESKKTELTYLDVDGQKSKFYAETRVKRDSIMQRMRTTRSFDRSQMENLQSNIDFIIEKDLATQSLIYQERIGRDQYSYNETPNLIWKILPDTAKIGEYQTQKAETNYGGRTWYAWFTQDIPLQDGPYKFAGLPGLIIKVEDSKGYYSFDLTQTKKIAAIQNIDSRGQIINLTKVKYSDLRAKFQKDPVSFMSANMGNRGGGPRGGRNQSGNTNPRQMQDMQKRMEAEIKSKNNPIELK